MTNYESRDTKVNTFHWLLNEYALLRLLPETIACVTEAGAQPQPKLHRIIVALSVKRLSSATEYARPSFRFAGPLHHFISVNDTWPRPRHADGTHDIK